MILNGVVEELYLNFWEGCIQLLKAYCKITIKGRYKICMYIDRECTLKYWELPSEMIEYYTYFKFSVILII